MKRTSQVFVVALLACMPALSEDEMTARIDTLIERWRNGDEAARVGVVAETLELGEEAVGELYRRLAGGRREEFPCGDPGVAMSEPKKGNLSDRLVSLEVRFGRLPREIADRPTLVTPPDLEKLQEGVETLSAPRLTVYDGQRANISILDRKTYVRTFDDRGQPVSGQVQAGFLLEVRPVVSGDGRFITLELRHVHGELTEPIGKLVTKRGEIMVPQVLKRETALTLTLEDGASAGLALPGAPALLITLHARIVELDLDSGEDEIGLESDD